MLDGGITLLDGSTFAITDGFGEIRGEPQGFFVADRRVLSRLRLRLADRQLMPLRVLHGDDNDVTVVRRAMPLVEEHAVPPLLVSWRVSVAPGTLRVHLLVRNTAPVARAAGWSVRLAGDFADIFAVKEGRADDTEPAVTSVTATDGRWRLDGPDLSLVGVPSSALVRVVDDGFAEELTLGAGQTADRELVLTVWARDGLARARGTGPARPRRTSSGDVDAGT